MTVKSAASYYEVLQQYADEYFADTGKATATTREIAVWAIQTGRWEAPPDLLLKQCREDFSKALREQYIKDDQGRPVRAKHVARVKRGDRQLHLWADIRSAPRKHIEDSFQLRREQIVGECRQLSRAKEYWNGAHPDQKPIQLVFDFRDDVEEGEFSGEYPPNKPR